MSHPAQQEFVERLKNNIPSYFESNNVLEVGSLDINGSIRQFFIDCNYTGIDIGEGPGVDIVCEGQNFEGEDCFYDVTCSTECFEHNPYWVETFQNMIRMTKSSGLVFFTCATTGRAEHGTTRQYPHCSPLTIKKGWEYYKNLTEEDIRDNFDLDTVFSSYEFDVEEVSCDLYFWGIKK